MSAEPLEDRIRQFFAGRAEDLVAVYLFGSVARETSRADSDVDVAVLLGSGPPSTFEGLSLRLEGDLERLLGRPLDLVVLDGAPVDLVHRVLRDGVLLVDRDPSVRIRFEVQARNEYFDLEPILKLYRRAPGGEPR